MKKLCLILFVFVSINSYAQLIWLRKSQPMPYPVSGGQVVYDIASGSDKMYIFGGYSDSLLSAVNWIQEYDAFNDRWQMVGNMLLEREQFVAGIWKNTVMYMGGTASGLSTDKYSMESWDYKIVTNLASTYDRNKNFGRLFSTGQIVGDIFYIIGGDPSTQGDSLDYITAYNLNTKKANPLFKSSSSNTLSQRMTFIVGDNIYIFGGVMNGVLNAIQRFNISTQTLYNLPKTQQLLEVRAAGAAVYNPISQKGFIIGGYNEKQNSMNSVEQIEIMQDGTLKITSIQPLTYARTNLMAVAYKNGYVAVFGGRSDRGHSGKTVPYVEILTENPNSTENEKYFPKDFELYQNYPNPFNPSTNVSFSISKRSSISLDVYSLLGEHVITLTSGDYEPGKYLKEWNAVDQFGNKVPSGIYFLQLRTGNFIQTKKMVLLK
jgi:hypothetical protein